MTIEKRGDINVAHTPDTEQKLAETPREKVSSEGVAEQALDDDATHRLARKVADTQ